MFADLHFTKYFKNVNVAVDNDAAGGVAAPAADQHANGEAQGNVEGDIGEGDVEGDEEEVDEDHAENEDNGNVANNGRATNCLLELSDVVNVLLENFTGFRRGRCCGSVMLRREGYLILN